MLHSSTRRSTPPSDVTQSASNNASPLAAPIVAMSLCTPVEVSACTIAYIAGLGMSGEHSFDVDRLGPIRGQRQWRRRRSG